jgi:hypothetical protein
VKKLFYAGLLLLVLFELANVYFIMPLPYSQRVRSIDVAYFLYQRRWWIRGGLGLVMLVGLFSVARTPGWRRWLAIPALGAAGYVAYVTNFVMSADHIFLPPNHVALARLDKNTVEPGRLVVGVDLGGEARAYPVRFVGYHHQVRDTVDGIPILVTFCTVCRTGRVFSPTIDGKSESFRLVGMDHFNAMFEDRTTGSWWRQATGEAVAGPRKGRALHQIRSSSLSRATAPTSSRFSARTRTASNSAATRSSRAAASTHSPAPGRSLSNRSSRRRSSGTAGGRSTPTRRPTESSGRPRLRAVAHQILVFRVARDVLGHERTPHDHLGTARSR